MRTLATKVAGLKSAFHGNIKQLKTKQNNRAIQSKAGPATESRVDSAQIREKTATKAWPPANPLNFTRYEAVLLHLLYVEAKKRDIAVGHAVVPPLGAQLALIFGALGAEGDKIFDFDDLGADKAALKVVVDAPGRAAGVGAGADRPGPALLGARGEKGRQPQEPHGGAGKVIEAELGHGILLQKLFALRGWQTRQLMLEAGAKTDEFGPLGFGAARQGGDAGALDRLALATVGDVEELLGRQQEKSGEQGLGLLVDGQGPRRQPLIEALMQADVELLGRLGFGGSGAHFGLDLVLGLFNGLQIGEQ